MFDVTWGEIAVLTGVGLVLIGRKDLPVASRALGQQVGRIVGLLQGARLRADRFTADHQLKKLQNEFRSGLRELDAVKAELAGSMMSGGGVAGIGGNLNLGAMVSGVDRRTTRPTMGATGGTMGAAAAVASSVVRANADPSPSSLQSMSASSIGAEYLAAAQQAESSRGGYSSSPDGGGGEMTTSARLAPRSQSVAAVAEEEWEKRGIGFRSVAEGGVGGVQQQQSPDGMDYSSPVAGGAGGGVILSNYLRQSLIYDQYERTVREQDEALRSRVDKVRKERASDNNKDEE
eukprot:CAMPEP_0181082660 /NCGR_PEP_ID=MMETSP1071-20121207/3742_1 /TAXON_ID=35127 /ORGANISM="Thalassiosira sp., Strain NH16" /LENGTH=289 /DNA_ID=CAMNT_0023164265 /DNA_START=25 /DNA_END=894 /DNA_ORIENTATION=+